MDANDLSARIQALRKERGISQKELGAMLGVSNKAVSKWENGESLPKTATILKMAELFGWNVSELMGGEETEKTAKELQSLKAENESLRLRLTEENRKKKKRILIGAVIGVLALAVTGVIAVFSGGVTEGNNRSLADVGKAGTSIVFGTKTYVPFTPLDTAAYHPDTLAFPENKYAEYTDTKGHTTKALVGCAYASVLRLKVKGKNEYYVEQSHAIRIETEQVARVVLRRGGSIADSTRQPYETNLDPYGGTPYDDQRTVDVFCRFFNDKNRKEVTDRTTELYLGNESRVLSMDVYDEEAHTVAVNLGEFFKDKEGNWYFYDYTNTKTYLAGEELKPYVTE